MKLLLELDAQPDPLDAAGNPPLHTLLLAFNAGLTVDAGGEGGGEDAAAAGGDGDDVIQCLEALGNKCNVLKPYGPKARRGRRGVVSRNPSCFPRAERRRTAIRGCDRLGFD